MSLRRSIIVITVTLAAIIVLGSIVYAREYSLARERNGVELASLVVLIDDAGIGSATSGCDSLTVHNFRSGQKIDSGIEHISPGRIAATADLSLIAANPANNCGQSGGSRGENPDCRSWIALRQPIDASFFSVRDGFYTGVDAAYKGGIAFLGDKSLLVATAAGRYDGAAVSIQPRAPFGVDRVTFPSRVSSSGVIASPLARTETPGLVGAIIPIHESDRSFLITTSGEILTVDSQTLVEVSPRMSYPTAESPRNRYSDTQPAIDAFHASALSDGSYIAISRLKAGDIAVVDTASGAARAVSISPALDFVGGIAFNNGWINQGLIALHASNRIMTVAFQPPSTLTVLGEISIPPPAFGERGITSSATGPQFSIAWSSDGSHLIVATQDGPAEFGVIEVLDEGSRLDYRRSLTACPDGRNAPNGIWTANGLIAPTATATSDVPPTLAPSPTATSAPTMTSTIVPSATATAAATPSTTPTSPVVPGPIHIPIALTERCDPTTQRSDVVLVIDASTSMRDRTRSGRPKIEAALDAVRVFLDLLALDAPGGDQAAIVAFNSDAYLVAPLTSDRTALDTALQSITLAQLTRLDRAVAVGADALTDNSRRRSANQPVLVLLTDGRANPVPVEAAVAEAAAAKATGITIFTIGVGTNIDVEALEVIASTPAGFLRAPDAEGLADIYYEVARSIPCPASAYWGGR